MLAPRQSRMQQQFPQRTPPPQQHPESLPKGHQKVRLKLSLRLKLRAQLYDGNGNDKGKGKGKGNSDPKGPPPKADASAKAKATVPCVFFPMGTCNRGKDCAFSHEAGGSSKSKGASVSSAAVAMLLPTTAAGRAVENATRVGKAATRGSYNSLLRIGVNAVCNVLATFATFVCPDFSLIAHETWASQSLAAPAILSLPAGVQSSSGSSYKLDWIADSGAGRSLTSFESLRAQGIYPDDLVCHEDEPVSFETGNGRTESSSTFNTIRAIFGHHKSYVLNSCPTVRSVGEIINQGFAFIWLPDELPFFVPKDALQMTADSSRVHKASRVEGNVPIFSEDVQFATPALKKLMHDTARSSKKSKDITFDAGSRDICFDPGVPTPSAAESRDPDPTIEVEEPKDSAEDPDQIMPPPPLPPPRESSEDDGLTKHR